MKSTLAGIFVGGKASRMGFVAKGLLASPEGDALVPRLHALLAPRVEHVVLAGAHAEYTHLGIPIVEDDTRAEGPLAGLLALLELAHARGYAHVLAVACDLPFVNDVLVERLLEPAAGTVAPRRDGRWEPLFARYETGRALDQATRRAREKDFGLQGLLTALDARMLALAPVERRLLDDWDTPEDVARAGSSAKT
jgi:molybdopterin-guanine dinucleotide biosynthesis protein A